MVKAIGQVAGSIHSTGEDYRYEVLGYLLHHDGVWVVGRYLDTGKLTGDWSEGFNRTPPNVIKQVNNLPLTKEQKEELLQEGVYPSYTPLETHLRVHKRMFEDFKHLLK